MAALLLLALLAASLLFPTEDGGVILQHIANKYVTNITRKPVEESGSSKTTSPSNGDARKFAEQYPDAAAAVAINSQQQFNALYKRASALGVSVRWMPALRRAMLHGRDAAVRELLSGEEFTDLEVEYNIQLSMIPEKRTEHIIGPSGRPFYDTALNWIGIKDDDSPKGRGAKIALLDTAVDMSAPVLTNANIVSDDLFGLGGEPGNHGTMVASLLVGSSELTKGAASDAEIISFPVVDAEGNGYVFNLAEAIVAAADSGAQIISMSLSCQYESAVLGNAVDYAISKGCVIVAAAGNEGVAADGTSTVGYPAAYKGVIAVGAVNADGRRAGFSSTGEEVTIVAPGVGLFAENSDGTELFGGTSASTPLVAGAIAYVMGKKENISAAEAAKTLLETTNDVGMPGDDYEYGLGQISVARALKSDIPNYNDSAAADIVLTQNDDGSSSAYFSGQNRGNESIGEMVLHCTLHFNTGESITEDIKFNNVSANQTVSLKLDVPDGETPLAAELSVTSSAEDDANSKNNSLLRFLMTPQNTDSNYGSN